MSRIFFVWLQEHKATIEVESLFGQHGLRNNAAPKRLYGIDPKLYSSIPWTIPFRILLTWLIRMEPAAALLELSYRMSA
jgi:hypothetical protein